MIENYRTLIISFTFTTYSFIGKWLARGIKGTNFIRSKFENYEKHNILNGNFTLFLFNSIMNIKWKELP